MNSSTRNRYFILGFLFLIWISFIDENNLVNLNNKTNNLENLQDEIDSLNNEIIELEERLERLNTDPDELERFARENFLMKKLGLPDGDNLMEAINTAIETYGKSERNKYRAVIYYMLTKHFGKEAVYG